MNDIREGPATIMTTSRKQTTKKKVAVKASAKPPKKTAVSTPARAEAKTKREAPEKAATGKQGAATTAAKQAAPAPTAKQAAPKGSGQSSKEAGKPVAQAATKVIAEEKTKATAVKAIPPKKVSRVQPEVDRMEEMREASPPKKAKIDPEFLKTVLEALVQQRQRLLSVMQSTQAQMAAKEVDLPDVSDRASGGFEDELAMGLMAIEAAQIDDIEAAIERINQGTYGLCANCEKPIPKKRLEVLPFARRCLNCEGERERHAMRSTEYEEEDES